MLYVHILFLSLQLTLFPQRSIAQNCTVKFHVELDEKPQTLHKAEFERSHKPHSPVMVVGTHQWVKLECSCCCDDSERIVNMTDHSTGYLQYKIVSTKGHVVLVSGSKKDHDHGKAHHPAFADKLPSTEKCSKGDSCSVLRIRAVCNETTAKPGFFMHAENLGRSEITTTLRWVNQSADLSAVQNWTIAQAQIFVNDGNETGHWEDAINVITVLKAQTHQMISDWCAAAIAFMIALSVGCCNEPKAIRLHLSKPSNVIVQMVCQLLVIPLMAIGITRCFSTDNDQAFGLFTVATLPGGGLAYLLTYLVNGDRHLSGVISLVTTWANLAICPAWMATVGWYYYKRRIHIGKTIGWLGTTTVGQILGTIIRAYYPTTASAILTWVTRPLLLLSGILLVTLGVYINHYAFREVSAYLIVCLLSLITIGFFLGWIAARITRQDLAVTRAMATETAVYNGLLCMTILRTSLRSPGGDLAAVVAVWMTLFFPIPLIYHAILTVLNRRVVNYFEDRKKRGGKKIRSVLVGMDDGSETQMVEIGATSAAAVTAAAIAVAPAIATTNSKEHHTMSRDENETVEKSASAYSFSSTHTNDERAPNSPRDEHNMIGNATGEIRTHKKSGQDRKEDRPALRKISTQRPPYEQHGVIYENPGVSPRRTDRYRVPPYTNL